MSGFLRIRWTFLGFWISKRLLEADDRAKQCGGNGIIKIEWVEDECHAT